MQCINLPDKKIGAGNPCFLIAEIGINHNGDLNLAFETIDAAANAGADAVKFQNYKTEDFLVDSEITYTYLSKGTEVTESQFEMFKRYELTREQLFQLAEYCKARGVYFMSTPTNKEGIQDCVEAGAYLLKNGSDFLGNLPLVKEMAKTGLTTILSTGMATLGEIEDAVCAFKACDGHGQLILLHCTSSYPTPAKDVHLNKIQTLQRAFGTHVGFSDHSEGVNAAILSISMGACVIEKHFTLDKNLAGPDHRFSCSPDEFNRLREGVRYAESCFGTSAIGYTSDEVKSREQFKLSCASKKDLPKGHKLHEEDIIFCRPGTGVSPGQHYLLLGRELNRPVKKGCILQLADLIS